ncbi:transporter substrate-binding domain-containing protein [Lacticaseibacillus sp. GG6-2]
MKFKRIVALAAVVAIGLIATGCGSKKAAVKTVTVGTGTNFRPFVYQDKHGNDTGYEIALIKAIDKKLPQYKFKISHYDFSNLFPALKNRRIDMVANQLESNAERRKLYQFSKVGYTNYDLHIVSLYGKYNLDYS